MKGVSPGSTRQRRRKTTPRSTRTGWTELDAGHVPHSFIETCLGAIGYTITSIQENGRTFLLGFADGEGFLGAVGRPPGAGKGLVFACSFDLDPREVSRLANFSEIVSPVITRDLREKGLRAVIEPERGPPRRIQILADIPPDKMVDGEVIHERVESLKAAVTRCLSTIEGFRGSA